MTTFKHNLTPDELETSSRCQQLFSASMDLFSEAVCSKRIPRSEAKAMLKQVRGELIELIDSYDAED